MSVIIFVRKTEFGMLVYVEQIWKNHFLLFGEKKPWACMKDGVRGKFCCNDNNTTNQ